MLGACNLTASIYLLFHYPEHLYYGFITLAFGIAAWVITARLVYLREARERADDHAEHTAYVATLKGILEELQALNKPRGREG